MDDERLKQGGRFFVPLTLSKVLRLDKKRNKFLCYALDF